MHHAPGDFATAERIDNALAEIAERNLSMSPSPATNTFLQHRQAFACPTLEGRML